MAYGLASPARAANGFPFRGGVLVNGSVCAAECGAMELAGWDVGNGVVDIDG
jgi:hypothetical protein